MSHSTTCTQLAAEYTLPVHTQQQTDRQTDTDTQTHNAAQSADQQRCLCWPHPVCCRLTASQALGHLLSCTEFCWHARIHQHDDHRLILGAYYKYQLKGHSESANLSRRYVNFFPVVFARWQHYIRRRLSLYGNGKESFNPILDHHQNLITSKLGQD